MPSLNSGALSSLVRSRWIRLVAVQCVMLWSIPKAGDDFPRSRPECDNVAFASCEHLPIWLARITTELSVERAEDGRAF